MEGLHARSGLEIIPARSAPAVISGRRLPAGPETQARARATAPEREEAGRPAAAPLLLVGDRYAGLDSTTLRAPVSAARPNTS